MARCQREQAGLDRTATVRVRKAGTPPSFSNPRDSFSFSVIELGTFKLGPAIALIGRRNAQNYKELYGLANVGYAAQIGGFAEYWPVPWLRLRVEVRQGIGGETGVTGNVRISVFPKHNPPQRQSWRRPRGSRRSPLTLPAAASIPTAPARRCSIASIRNGRPVPSSSTNG